MDVRKWALRQAYKAHASPEHADVIADAFTPAITKLVEALRLWKCPMCGGSRKFKGYSKGLVFTDADNRECRMCKDTDGLHRTAWDALAEFGGRVDG